MELTKDLQTQETALKLAEGLMTVDVIDGEPINFSQSFSCPKRRIM